MPVGFRCSVRLRRAVVLILLFGGALGVRMHGLGRESFWTDEGATVSLSEGGVALILERNAADVHPPLYFLGLHAWRRVFGDSDFSLRAYCLPWSLLGLLALFLLAVELGGRRVGLIALLLAAVNPLDIYFAQEARNYAQATALCTLGSWCLWRWMQAVAPPRRRDRWWTWALGYGLCAVAALYTHCLCVMILMAQGQFAVLWFAWHERRRCLFGFLACAVGVAVMFLPWVFFVRRIRSTFYNPALGWMVDPSPSDYLSFLGREFFWGQALTVHDAVWRPTLILPVLVLAVCAARLLKSRASNPRPTPAPNAPQILYPCWLLAGPLLPAALISRLYHPVYFRARFALFLLPPFLILAAIACASFRNRRAARAGAALLGGLMLTGTFVQRERPLKLEWRGFVRQWKEDRLPPAVFFPRGIEAVVPHYLKIPYVSPPRAAFERLLPALEGRDVWICSLPEYTFYIWEGEYEYYQWLLCLGPVRDRVRPNSLHIQIVKVRKAAERKAARLDRWYAPVDTRGRIDGFGVKSDFYALQHDRDTGAPFRWSAPRARFCLRDTDRVSTVIVNVQLPPWATEGNARAALRFHTARGSDGTSLFSSPPAVELRDPPAGPFEVRLNVGLGAGPMWIGWNVEGVSAPPSRGFGDTREMGLRVNWIGAGRAPF